MPIVGHRNKITLLPEDEKFLRDNYLSMTNRELADSLNLNLTKTREFLYNLGLKRMEMEYWTQDQIDFLKANYKTIGDVEISEFFQAEWPKIKKWTEKHIRKKRVYLNLHRTEKQVKKIRSRNAEAGRYTTVEKRWKTTGSNDIGTIVFWRKSNSEVKFPLIKTETGYQHYYRWLYIKERGELNSDQLVVAKMDAPKDILLSIEHLEIIDRSEHARRNHKIRMQYPEEIRQVTLLLNKITKHIKKHKS